MYDGLTVTFFWFSSQGIIILVRMMDSARISMLITLIVSSDLVASVSRYPWQDHEMSWRQRGGRVGYRQTDRQRVGKNYA